MPISIPEPDWKVFKRIREVTLQRYCERVISEARHIIDDGSSSMSMLDRYHELYTLMKERDKTLGRVVDDPRRSTALMQIGVIRSMKLWTDEEMAEFSQETRNYVDALFGRDD